MMSACSAPLNTMAIQPSSCSGTKLLNEFSYRIDRYVLDTHTTSEMDVDTFFLEGVGLVGWKLWGMYDILDFLKLACGLRNLVLKLL